MRVSLASPAPPHNSSAFLTLSKLIPSAYSMDTVSDIVGYLRFVLRGGLCDLDSSSVDVGIVCGSGLSGLSSALEGPVSVPYASIPHFPMASVAGHGQELVFGRLGGKLVVCARGRFHYCA